VKATVRIRVVNHASTSHGLDSHALRIDMRRFDPVPPGESLVIEKAVDTPGVYMYHCASGPVTDIWCAPSSSTSDPALAPDVLRNAPDVKALLETAHRACHLSHRGDSIH
jgi:hypothetical protein